MAVVWELETDDPHYGTTVESYPSLEEAKSQIWGAKWTPDGDEEVCVGAAFHQGYSSVYMRYRVRPVNEG